jgi:hypothetical protein
MLLAINAVAKQLADRLRVYGISHGTAQATARIVRHGSSPQMNFRFCAQARAAVEALGFAATVSAAGPHCSEHPVLCPAVARAFYDHGRLY